MPRDIAGRTITVQGHVVALLMLRGIKKVENRKTKLAPGWYNLHVGNTDLQKTLPAAVSLVHSTWPDAPAENTWHTYAKSCIVGRVLLTKALLSEEVAAEHPWAIPSVGRFSLVIEESIEFQNPVLSVKGAQGVWYAAPDVLQAVQLASIEGTHRKFEGPLFPSLVDQRSSRKCAAPTKCIQRWTKKTRKTRNDAGIQKKEVAGVAIRAFERDDLEGSRQRRRKLPSSGPHWKRRRAANLPASSEAHQVAVGDQRQSPVVNGSSRVAAGRTPSLLHNLMRQHFFCDMEPLQPPSAGSPERPRRGLFAWSSADACWCFVVGTFSRRSTSLVDVCPLKASGPSERGIFRARYGDVVTRKADRLHNVGRQFRPVPRRRRGIATFLDFKQKGDVGGQELSAREHSESQACLRLAELWGGSMRSTPARDPAAVAHSKREVKPASLQEHLCQMAESDRPHKAIKRVEKLRELAVLDTPLPVMLDTTPWRCMTCHRESLPATYYATPQDIQRAVGEEVFHYSTSRHGSHFFTKKFLLHFVQSFFEKMCIRACRRALTELYLSNALACCGGARTLRYFAAVPQPEFLKAFATQALENFLSLKVRHFRRLINVYSGSVISGDGHWRLAQRIIESVPGHRYPRRPWNVLIGWCFVDGALADVPRPAKGEAIEDLLLDLEPIVDDLREDRLENGLSPAEAVPVGHSTDSYGKHRKEYEAFYERKNAEAQIAVQAPSPKGDASGAVGSQSAAPLTTIVGDPSHECHAFNRALSISANDYWESWPVLYRFMFTGCPNV